MKHLGREHFTRDNAFAERWVRTVREKLVGHLSVPLLTYRLYVGKMELRILINVATTPTTFYSTDIPR